MDPLLKRKKLTHCMDQLILRGKKAKEIEAQFSYSLIGFVAK